jgi:hypothetical protein
MSTLTTVRPNMSGRHPGLRPILMILGALLIAFAMIGVLAPSSAQAANVGVSQCNNRLSGALGAENTITCNVTVDNYVDNGVTSSRTTVSLVCSLNPCSGTPVSSTSPNLVTNVAQCNGSATQSAAVVICNVVIRNHISPNPSAVLPATLNQCVGSSGAGTADLCVPATTSGAPVTQCNGSVTGGGGGINCTMATSSTVTAALPVIVNQCNGTATGGGSFLTCTVSLSNDNSVVGAPFPGPTSAPTTKPPVSTPTAPGTLGLSGPPAGTPTLPGTLVGAASPPTGQVLFVPSGGVQTGGGSTSGLQHAGLLLAGAGLFVAAGLSAGLRRRFTRGS